VTASPGILRASLLYERVYQMSGLRAEYTVINGHDPLESTVLPHAVHRRNDGGEG